MAKIIRRSCSPRARAAIEGPKRTTVIVTAGSAIALLAGVAGCDDSGVNTDLDPSGDPEVLIVTAQSEANGTFIPVLGDNVPDVPLFCATAGRINRLLCPVDATAPGVTDAPPMGWSVRIVFSELLDADLVEELVDEDGDGIMDFGTIINTQPVTLTCGGTAVAYDGFYDPSGNAFTFPPGPSLVVATSDFIATGTSDCAVTVGTDKVKDKDGNSVPGTLVGPYNFGIATMKLTGSDPQDLSEGIEPSMTVPSVSFNAPVDLATVTQLVFERVSFDRDAMGNPVLDDMDRPTNVMVLETIAVTPAVNADSSNTIDVVLDTGTLADNTSYRITIPANATITDIEGGALEMPEDLQTYFTTGVADTGM